jgi:hypothetical protein
MEALKNLQPLREFCRKNPWPRITQWNHWINSRHSIALKTIKKIGGRYVLDVEAFQEIVRNATLDEK